MDELAQQIIDLFGQMNRESLDLHTLFEAGGNEPASRERVIDVVSQLVADGLLEERGSDFYALTTKGRVLAGIQ
ncbi:MAG TPA: hypothetical protein VN937_18065 [Blastocatellia bacterium]|nr:hypothetical protein [Blastocatellia bacterium]